MDSNTGTTTKATKTTHTTTKSKTTLTTTTSTTMKTDSHDNTDNDSITDKTTGYVSCPLHGMIQRQTTTTELPNEEGCDSKRSACW
jgi:hypothetical protein